MQRYFAKEYKDKIILEDSDIHHIKNVMRMKNNDKIEVVYDNKLYICNIDNIDSVKLSIEEIINEENKLNLDITKHALDVMEVDNLGLDYTDRKLLLTMMDRFNGKPVGLDTLAASTGEEANTIEDVYEPYLLQIGFIARTPRGRVCLSLTRYSSFLGRASRSSGW